MKNCVSKIFALAGALLLCALPALSAPEIVVDKKNASSATEYSVSLCVRKSPGLTGLPGHCYVRWLKKQNGSIIEDGKYGFYPDSTNHWKVAFVDGTVKTEDPSLTDPSDCTVTVLVSQPAYDVSVHARQKYGPKATYTLGISDCVSMCDDVAQALGINHPSSTSFSLPANYIHRVYEENSPGLGTAP